MTTAKAKRDKTINLRVPSAQNILIERAARETGDSRSDFMLRASLERAEAVLADQTRFVLTKEQWLEFHKALDAPLPKPEALAKLLNRPRVWGK